MGNKFFKNTTYASEIKFIYRPDVPPEGYEFSHWKLIPSTIPGYDYEYIPVNKEKSDSIPNKDVCIDALTITLNDEQARIQDNSPVNKKDRNRTANKDDCFDPRLKTLQQNKKKAIRIREFFRGRSRRVEEDHEKTLKNSPVDKKKKDSPVTKGECCHVQSRTSHNDDSIMVDMDHLVLGAEKNDRKIEKERGKFVFAISDKEILATQGFSYAC